MNTHSLLTKIAPLALAALAASLAGGWALTLDSGSEAVSAPGVIDEARPEVGKPAPDFGLVDARNPDRIIHLSDFAGRPVILNWYASWCGPCRAEIPTFLDAQRQLGDEISILGVNLQEPADRAVGLLDEFDAGYPAVLDSEGTVFAHFAISVGGMPTTYFIDAEGIVRDAGQGMLTPEALSVALATVGVEYVPD